MKRIIALAVLAAAFAGCSSYTDIGRLSPNTGVRTDDGKRPIATVDVLNVSYSLLGLLPIESGVTWKSGPYASRPSRNATWFEDRCTIDENLASVRAALRELDANEVANLVTESDSWRFWSLFIVKRTVLKSTCTVLK